MPIQVARAAVASYPNLNPDGDAAVSAQLAAVLPAVLIAYEWNTATNTQTPINLTTNRPQTSAAAAAAAAYDPHVQQPMRVVVADRNNPVVGAYAGQREQQYAATPFAATAGYQVATPFQNDQLRKFFKMPSGTAAEQAAVTQAYNGLITDPQNAAVLATAIGPALNFANHQAQRQQYLAQQRGPHHAAKSAGKTQRFYHAVDQHMAAHPVTRSMGTEMRGEVATAEWAIQQHGYQLKMAFDGQGHTGIDQIWVRRVNGQIVEYLIVEAKGSYNAKLGTAQKGTQMSPRWIYESLREMVQAGAHASTGRKVLAAIHGAAQGVAVTGALIKCKYKPTLGTNAHDQHTIIYHNYGDYNIAWV